MRCFPFLVVGAIAQAQIDEDAVARAYQSLAQHLLPTLLAYNSIQTGSTKQVPPPVVSKAEAELASRIPEGSQQFRQMAGAGQEGSQQFRQMAGAGQKGSQQFRQMPGGQGVGGTSVFGGSGGGQVLEGAQVLASSSSGMENYPIMQSLGEAVRNAAEIPAMVLNEALLTQATNAVNGAAARGASANLRGNPLAASIRANGNLLLNDINEQASALTTEGPWAATPQSSSYMPIQPMFQSQTEYIEALTAAGVPRFVPMVVSSLLAPLGLLKMEASTQVQDFTKSIAEGATLQPAIQSLNNAFIQPALNQLPPTPFTSALDNAVSFAMNRLSDGAQQAVFPIQAAAMAANALASAIGDFSAAAVPFPVPTSGTVSTSAAAPMSPPIFRTTDV